MIFFRCISGVAQIRSVPVRKSKSEKKPLFTSARVSSVQGLFSYVLIIVDFFHSGDSFSNISFIDFAVKKFYFHCDFFWKWLNCIFFLFFNVSTLGALPPKAEGKKSNVVKISSHSIAKGTSAPGPSSQGLFFSLHFICCLISIWQTFIRIFLNILCRMKTTNFQNC